MCEASVDLIYATHSHMPPYLVCVFKPLHGCHRHWINLLPPPPAYELPFFKLNPALSTSRWACFHIYFTDFSKAPCASVCPDVGKSVWIERELDDFCRLPCKDFAFKLFVLAVQFLVNKMTGLNSLFRKWHKKSSLDLLLICHMPFRSHHTNIPFYSLYF